MAYFYVQLCAMTLLFRLRDGMADLRVSMPNFHYVQNRHKQQKTLVDHQYTPSVAYIRCKTNKNKPRRNICYFN